MEHHADSEGVADYVSRGVVGEAGVFVFLRALLVCHRHPLARQFAAAKLADSGDYVG